MLGARIAALRRQAGLSQAALAEKIGVSPSAVGMYEQGRREPAAQILVELSQALGVSVDYILTGSPREQEADKLQKMFFSRLSAANRRLDGREERPFSREELAVLFAAMLMEP